MLKLALRNLLRQRFRAGMTLASIAIGVACLVVAGGFVRDIFVQLGEALIHSQSGHLQIAATGSFSPGSGVVAAQPIAEPERLRRDAGALPGVDDVLARMRFSGLLNNGRTDWPIVGEGIEPDKEARLGSYLRIVDGRLLRDGDRSGALVGQGVAQALKLQPGSQVTLLVNTPEGALNTTDLEVVGVFQSFSRDFDARAIRVPIAVVHEMLGSADASVLVISLRSTDDTPAVAASLLERTAGRPVEIRTWQELNDFYDKTVALYQRQFGVLQLIILAMVLLAVANSVNMGTLERTGEFGTMRALGNRGGDVFRLVMAESAIAGLIGSAMGAALGVALALAISAVGIPMPPPPNSNLAYVAYIRVVPAEVAAAFVVGLAATVLAALLPAARVSRTPVVDALRENV